MKLSGLYPREKRIQRKRNIMENELQESYDFSNAIKNPYISKLKKQITIRLDADTIAYFKDLSAETGIKYQQLINLYLRDCAENHKKIKIKWTA
jgi:uncharacterized protein (DUF4415 family)